MNIYKKMPLKKGNIIEFKNGKKMIFIGESKVIEFTDSNIHDISKAIVECNGISNVKASLFNNASVYPEKDRPKLNFNKTQIDSLKYLIDNGFYALIKGGNSWVLFSGQTTRDMLITVTFNQVETFRREFGKLEDGEYKLKDLIKWAENDNKNERTSKKGN